MDYIQKKKFYKFIETLKIHNKDLDVCFNDAMAVHHLIKLFENTLTIQREEMIKEIKEKVVVKWGEYGDPVIKSDLIPFLDELHSQTK